MPNVVSGGDGGGANKLAKLQSLPINTYEFFANSEF